MKNQGQITFFSQYARVLNIGDWTYIDNSFGHNRIRYILELPQLNKGNHQGKAELYICVLPNSFRYGVRTEIICHPYNHSIESDWLDDWFDCFNPDVMTAEDRMNAAIALSHELFDKSINVYKAYRKKLFPFSRDKSNNEHN
jgi:hypothetical protein